ncbi:class II myosin, partial [Linderina pennispora]
MTLLSKITNDAINDNLKKRFHNADIYTYIGNVLISVNPFRDLGIYTPQVLKSYENKNRMEQPPHVYAIAEGAFRNMVSYRESQCVIISGESGAGKTEAAKKIMEYIAAVSGSGGAGSGISGIKDMVLATNPLLESFGCAKTLRNNNSSRHGKYLEIQFNAGGEPVGAIITNYLLEKNRVVGQIKNERNFHIFYQFAKAASQEYRDMFGVSGPESYLYTSAAGCLDVPNIDDAKDYADTIKAMNTIGITKDEQAGIHRMLATILWLGNVQFTEDDDGGSAITDPNITQFVAYLLEANQDMVSKALTKRTIETSRGGRRGSVYDVPLNTSQARAARDGLSKAIYGRLFDWIVARVNTAMQAREAASYII